MDFEKLSPADLSHAMLVAILMQTGGTLVLPADAFETDALGGPDGSWHAVGLQPRLDGTFRLSVLPRPDVDEEGISFPAT